MAVSLALALCAGLGGGQYHQDSGRRCRGRRRRCGGRQRARRPDRNKGAVIGAGVGGAAGAAIGRDLNRSSKQPQQQAATTTVVKTETVVVEERGCGHKKHPGKGYAKGWAKKGC